MNILIYKRTHDGDPDANGNFGNEGCMGSVRDFQFDAVIGIGGISYLPTKQGLSRKINWVGRNPTKSANPLDGRGPLVSFSPINFRLFESQGPLFEEVAPTLAKKLYGSRARYVFTSLNGKEKQEAMELIRRFLDQGEFDHLQLTKNSPSDACINPCGKQVAKPQSFSCDEQTNRLLSHGNC